MLLRHVQSEHAHTSDPHAPDHPRMNPHDTMLGHGDGPFVPRKTNPPHPLLPQDPFSDWFSAAPSTAASGLVNCLLASISVLVASQLL
jgi:hypothetical protein